MKAALDQFLEQQSLDVVVDAQHLTPSVCIDTDNAGDTYATIDGKQFAIRRSTSDKDDALVPRVTFFNNPSQNRILRMIAEDLMTTRNAPAILLIGNQGVGKNRLVDHLLSLLNMPRQYMQLHRDSTVASLTALPTIRDGRLVYLDSPLVVAAHHGHVLVLDEADKASVQVVMVLKSLVEEGEIALGDGRRIVNSGAPSSQPNKGILNKDIRLHPDFRLVVLANRPGYPFHGNDFYREVGDAFSTHTIEHLSAESELEIVQRYAPNVASEILNRLSAVFLDLRKLSDDGVLAYPYSMREFVHVARHLDRFPRSGVAAALKNVFDFDHYTEETTSAIVDVLRKHGLDLESGKTHIAIAKEHKLSTAVLQSTFDLVPDAGATANVTTSPLPIRGAWKMVSPRRRVDVHRSSHDVSRISENLFEFDLPYTGTAIGAASLSDGSVAVLCSNPLTLGLITPTFRSTLVIDLHEKMSTGDFLSITVIGSKLFPDSVFVVDRQTGIGFVHDLKRNVTTALQVPTMEEEGRHEQFTLVDDLAKFGCLGM